MATGGGKDTRLHNSALIVPLGESSQMDDLVRQLTAAREWSAFPKQAAQIR